MKILCVANYASDVGYAWRLMEEFWAGIARANPGRVMLCYPQMRAIPAVIASAPIEVVHFDFDFAKPAALVDFVRHHRIEHLYLTDRLYTSPLYRRLRKAGVRTITVHDHTPGARSRPGLVKRAVKWMRARSSHAADAYIAVSQTVMDRFLNVCMLLPHCCHLARNGIDLLAKIEAIEIRYQLGIPHDAIVVVSSGRVHEYKRITTIIEAAAMVDDDIYFIHCGDGEDMQQCRELIRKRGLERRFFMLGKRDDVPSILAASNIAVHASKGEAASLAILEFMRAKLPVVLPDEPTVAQEVRHERDGLLYESGNAKELANAIVRLVDDAAFRHHMGQAAYAHVLQYDLRKTIIEVVNVIGRMTAKH